MGPQSHSLFVNSVFMTLIPSLTFTDYEWFPWSICNGCGMPAGNAYPSGHLVPSPILGLANAPIVETKFLELAMSLLDFSPRIPLGTFSILLHTWVSQNIFKYCENEDTYAKPFSVSSFPRFCRQCPQSRVIFQTAFLQYQRC